MLREFNRLGIKLAVILQKPERFDKKIEIRRIR
jgi:hypothetical protein